jgi:hypothetical protein
MNLFDLSRDEMKDLLSDYSSRNLDRRNAASRELTRLVYCAIVDSNSLSSSEESSDTQSAIFSHIASNSFLDIDASRLNKEEIDKLDGDEDAILDHLLDNSTKVEIWIVLG